MRKDFGGGFKFPKGSIGVENILPKIVSLSLFLFCKGEIGVSVGLT
jgi:hypothetical protein